MCTGNHRSLRSRVSLLYCHLALCQTLRDSLPLLMYPDYTQHECGTVSIDIFTLLKIP